MIGYETIDEWAHAYFPLGFHLSREAWDRYGLAETLRRRAGEPGWEHTSIQELALAMNRTRQATHPGASGIRPGHLWAFGLLDTIHRYLFHQYCQEMNPGVMGKAVAHLARKLPRGTSDVVVEAFVDLYPPSKVYLGEEAREGYLAGSHASMPNRHAVLRETALLSVIEHNPALESFGELYDDAALRRRVAYDEVVAELEAFFEQQPRIEAVGLSLFSCLRAPIYAAPDSIEGQLEYVRIRWAGLLPGELMRQLTVVRDTLREELQVRGGGPGEARVLHFGPGRAGAGAYDYPEFERFTLDADWMSTMVLIAKVVYVWLDQLSRIYGHSITRLDQVPDEELDRLAYLGFTGLWLIGIWERSSASEDIKKRMGNLEAAASAYSLYDYVVADDLGGEAALRNLRDRTARRGIRLASDMVPNHTGIYSKWMIEHPDWFIQDAQPPFPSYSFSGPDVCPDPRVAVQIEDGYWTHRDAAVVFKRTDTASGEVRYIYHGNDGTNMPWNDTAQLNYLNPEVREAVIRTIVRVARQFPIIRFDAAMTLAKRHYQRLWFPLPGEGGAIPSRAQHSMTREAFDAAFPEEFWREVVDRVQAEVPNTLLIAEAFWLMEGYFVRTLGMHRVYNSAFMNMLKMEDNLKYRMTIKNVLEFSPEILKRFVNFMNNPDELTAVEQFGDGDKYFGVVAMMMTMPGLPMFGHGQIEGFTEKYGMEYRRAYWNESINEHMLQRHEREVLPLVRKRHLFSGVDHFAFYDFVHPDNYVDESVFAYSNRLGDERALVVYNNAYSTTRGRLHTSTAMNRAAGDERDLFHKTLAESLGLCNEPGAYYLFREHRTGLEYVRAGAAFSADGFELSLQGYEYNVFLDFREVRDVDGTWAEVARRLGGSGSRDIGRIYREVLLDPVVAASRAFLNAEMLGRLAASRRSPQAAAAARKRVSAAYAAYLDEAEQAVGLPFDRAAVLEATLADLKVLQQLGKMLEATPLKPEVRSFLLAGRKEEGPLAWGIPISWALVRNLEEALSVDSANGHTASWVEDWLLTTPLAESFEALGREDWRAREDARLVMLLVQHTHTLLSVHEDELVHLLEEMLEDPAARDYLYVNEFNNVLWLNREQLEAALNALALTAAVTLLADHELTPDQQAELITVCHTGVQSVLRAAKQSGYEVARLLEILAETP